MKRYQYILYARNGALFRMKRGASHIEVILAFALFIGFVGFALYFFSPTDTSRLVDTTLIYTFDEIKKATSVQIDTYKIKFDQEAISLAGNPEIISVNIGGEQERNSYSWDTSGNEIKSYSDWPFVNIKHNGKNNIEVILGKDIEPGEVVGSGIDSFYQIVSADSERVISEKKFLDIEERYKLDYVNLKKDFNLPNRVSFSIFLKFGDGETYELDRPAPNGLDIFSENKRVEVLRLNNQIEFADLSVSVW